MRYDTRIYMRTVELGTYDPATGNYGEPKISEVEQMAAIHDTGEERMKLLYGKISQGSLTIQLQNHYDDPFDRIRIGEKLYTVDMSRRLRTKQIYVVSEVQE